MGIKLGAGISPPAPPRGGSAVALDAVVVVLGNGVAAPRGGGVTVVAAGVGLNVDAPAAGMKVGLATFGGA